MIGENTIGLLRQIADRARTMSDDDRNALLRQLARVRSAVIQQQYSPPPMPRAPRQPEAVQ